MSDDEDLAERRKALRQQIGTHEKEQEAEQARRSSSSTMAGYAIAFRLSTELVAGVLVGGAIGYGLDWLLGTSPWLLIFFFLLGFVAGVLNVLRSSGLIQSPQVGKRPPKPGDKPG